MIEKVRTIEVSGDTLKSERIFTNGLYAIAFQILGLTGNYSIEVSLDGTNYNILEDLGIDGVMEVELGTPTFINVVDVSALYMRISADVDLTSATMSYLVRSNT